MRSGITRRWLRGNLLLTVLLLVLVEGMFLYSYTRSYYNGVQQTMVRRFSSITGQLKMYTGDTAQKASASRSVALRRMVEQFSDKDKYEFMLLDSYGGVIASSSGTDADGIVTQSDFEQAQDAVDGMGVALYKTQSGEQVMSVCYLVPYAAEDVAAMRLVTSMTLVTRQLKNAIAVSGVIVLAILVFTVMSGLYFVRSIVVPLGQVERTAASIARGELDVRLPVTGDQRDEVDRLRGTINQMAEGLEETEKMKNEFISSVSHELRTPLTSIRGWVETLRALNDPADENYRKGLEIINNETVRLYNMVEELLDFSRLQNGRIQMNNHPLDLVAELTDAVLFCEARIRQEGMILSYTEPEEMIPVYADPDRLRQVFINILDNAIKYSAPGGRITVKLWKGQYKAFIEIIDQGRGIPPEDLENVKTKFYKGSNSVRGSGIGLALVDSIMTALDGTLDIAVLRGEYPWDGTQFLLSQEDICLIYAREYEGKPLSDYLYIDHQTDASLGAQMARWRYENGVTGDTGSFVVDNIIACLEMVKRGLGWALIPEIALDNFDGCVRPCTFENGEPFLRRTYIFCQRDADRKSVV